MTDAAPKRGTGSGSRPDIADYSFLLVDLDGTLVDVEHDYARSVMHRIGDHVGASFTDADADRLWFGYEAARAAVFERHGVDRDAFWLAFHEVEEPAARATATSLYDDTRWLAEVDVPLGLVTHCQEYLTRPVLERVGIADWFDAVVCCTDETGWKPHVEPLELARSKLGVDDGSRGAFVGDAPVDASAARNAGLDGICLDRGNPGTLDRCVLAEYRIESFRELLNEPHSGTGSS